MDEPTIGADAHEYLCGLEAKGGAQSRAAVIIRRLLDEVTRIRNERDVAREAHVKALRAMKRKAAELLGEAHGVGE
jgi:hypothetical protein